MKLHRLPFVLGFLLMLAVPSVEGATPKVKSLTRISGAPLIAESHFVPLGINDAGQIVGFIPARSGRGSLEEALLFYSNGSVTLLGTLGNPGSDNSRANGINDFGDIVDSSTNLDGDDHAFLLRQGVMTDLGTLGGDESHADHINNAGEIVGEAYLPNREIHIFLYKDGTMTDLGFSGDPRGLDELGRIVGDSNQVAFLYADGQKYLLSELAGALMSDGTQPGFTSLQFAGSINNNGQIVGHGVFSDGLGGSHQDGFLLELEGDENEWTVTEGAARSFFEDTNWSLGKVPAVNESYRLGDGISTLVFNKDYANGNLTSARGGSNTFNLAGRFYSVKKTDISEGSVMLLDGQGRFETRNLLLGLSGTGEFKVLSGEAKILDTAAIGSAPGLTGRLVVSGPNSSLRFTSDAPLVSLGSSPGGGEAVVENGAAIDWGKAVLVSDATEASFLRVRGEGTSSLGGLFSLDGPSELIVSDQAHFEVGVEEADGVLLHGASARFESGSDGALGVFLVEKDGGALFDSGANFFADQLQARDGGQIRIANTAELDVSRLSLAHGGVFVEAGGTLRIMERYLDFTPLGGHSLLTVSGTGALLDYSEPEPFAIGGFGSSRFEVSAGAVARFPEATLTINGLDLDDAVTVEVTGALSELSANGLELRAEGTLRIRDGALLSVNKDVIIDKATFELLNASSAALSNIKLTNGGFMELIQGVGVSAADLVATESQVAVLANSELRFVGTEGVALNSSVLLLGNGCTIGGTIFTADENSVIYGRGRIDFNPIVSGARLEPGTSPGTLTLGGDLKQTGGSIVLEIGGAEPSQQDRLVVEGNLELKDCVVVLVFKNGFAPVAGQTFPFISAAGTSVSSGVTVRVSGLEPGWAFEPQVGNGGGAAFGVRSLSDGVARPSEAPNPSQPFRIQDFSVSPTSGGGLMLSGHVAGGEPGSLVRIESSPDLGETAPWRPVLSLLVNPDGSGTFFKVLQNRPPGFFLRAAR